MPNRNSILLVTTMALLIVATMGLVVYRRLLPNSSISGPADPFTKPSLGTFNSSRMPTISPITRIPFTLSDSNNIVVQVRFNDAETLNLMLHTSANSVTLTREAVKKLSNVQLKGSVSVKSWGGDDVSPISYGNRLRIGESEWQDQTVFINELSGHGTDGKFGLNLFVNQFVEINYDRREIAVYDQQPEFVSSYESAFQKLDIAFEEDCLYIPATIQVSDQTYSLRFMIHSGFSGTALLDDAFVAANDLTSKLETISERKLQDSFGNVLTTRKVKLNQLAVGKFPLADVPIEIFDGSIGQQKVCVLGADILKRFNIVIDSSRQHLYLAPSNLQRVAFGG